MPHDRKLTPRHRFRDASHMKLMNLFKSLRHRRIRRDPSLKSSTHSPFVDDYSPAQPLPPDLSTSLSLHLSSHRSGAQSIPSITKKDGSSGMSPSSSTLWVLSDLDRGHVLSSHSVPNFPTSPSTFQLRSASTKDYLVDRLEQYLGQLHLGDASPTHDGDVSLLDISPHDLPMDVSPQRAPSARATEKRTASPSVPMILITSVNAKHAKPLPPSAHRRTPLGPSNTGRPADPTLHDDPFVAYGAPLPDRIAFRLPYAFKAPCYAPETPTPMHCHHARECRGDLWEILHPPLVADRFTLPPFKLPPLRTGLFDVP